MTLNSTITSFIIIIFFLQGCFFPVIMVYALDGYEDTLKESLLEGPINWKENLMFKEILAKHLPVVKEVTKLKNCEIERVTNLVRMYIPIEDALKIQIE